MASRSKKGIRNIITGTGNKIVLMILPFISRSVIIYIFGSDYLGLSSLFTSVLTVLNLSELGFGSALVYSMYKPVAEDDIVKISALLNLYRKVFRVIASIILFVGIALIPFLPHLIKGDVPNGINIYLLYCIYLVNTVVSYTVFAHKKALVIAYQRNDILSNVNTICTLVLYAFQIGVLITIRNYYLYAILLPVMTIIENIIICRVAKKMFPNITEGGSVSQGTIAEIKKHVKGIALRKLSSVSRNSLDSIIISSCIGLTTVAIYNNYYTIMFSFHAFLYMIPNSIRSIVGNSIAVESKSKNFNDLNTMSFIYIMICGVVCVCLITLFQPFITLWLGEEMLLSFSSVILLGVYFIELSLSDIIALYDDGAGLWWHGRYRTVIEAGSNLGLNIVLGKIWGVNGIIIATVVTMLVFGVLWEGKIVFKYFFTDEVYYKYIFRQCKNILTIGISCAATYVIVNMASFSGVIGFFIKSLLSVSLSSLFLIILNMHSSQMKDARIFINNIIRNRAS